MLKRLLSKLNKQRGSATVEAVVAFTGFILVIFTILSLVNLCRAQMLISSAMDNAAKELSQYAYFYKMSGLQKFSAALEEKAAVGREDINSVIGSVDEFYGSVVGAVNDTAEGYTNIANATQEGTLQWSDVETAYNSITANADNINSKVDSMMSQFEAIGDNPMAYMKSLVAIAGSEGLDLVKSHLIAAPLAKMFVRQQFGGKEKADQTLEQLGVKDGLDGMNFKMSSMFTREHPDDICLVVFYEVELIQLFDMNVLTVKLSKQSRCGAWLAGDNVQQIVDPTKPTTAPSGGTGTTDTTDPTAGTTTTDPTTETTVPQQTPVDTTNSYWHLGDGGYGVENAGVENALHNEFNATYNINPDNIGSQMNYVSGRDNKNETTDKAYKWDYGVSPDPDDFDMSFVMLEVSRAEKAIDEGHLPADTQSVTYVLYVPENIPEADYLALKSSASEAIGNYNTFLMNHPPEDPDRVSLSIEIVKTGGNYDYSSGGVE